MHDDEGLCAACTTKGVLILQVQPGDTIVIRVEKPVPHAIAEQMMALAHEVWPDNKTLLFTGKVEIEIVRPGAEANG